MDNWWDFLLDKAKKKLDEYNAAHPVKREFDEFGNRINNQQAEFERKKRESTIPFTSHKVGDFEDAVRNKINSYFEPPEELKNTGNIIRQIANTPNPNKSDLGNTVRKYTGEVAGGAFDFLNEQTTPGGVASWLDPGMGASHAATPWFIKAPEIAAEKGLTKSEFKLFHGTDRLHNVLNEGWNKAFADKSDTLGWMGHAAENPSYAESYMGGMKGHGHIPGEETKGIIPVTLPEKTLVMDTWKPDEDDFLRLHSAAPAGSDLQNDIANAFRRFKQTGTPAEYGGDPSQAMRGLVERFNPEDFKKTGIGAIRYPDAGNKAWAFPDPTIVHGAYTKDVLNSGPQVPPIPKSWGPPTPSTPVYKPVTKIGKKVKGASLTLDYNNVTIDQLNEQAAKLGNQDNSLFGQDYVKELMKKGDKLGINYEKFPAPYGYSLLENAIKQAEGKATFTSKPIKSILNIPKGEHPAIAEIKKFQNEQGHISFSPLSGDELNKLDSHWGELKDHADSLGIDTSGYANKFYNQDFDDLQQKLQEHAAKSAPVLSNDNKINSTFNLLKDASGDGKSITDLTGTELSQADSHWADLLMHLNKEGIDTNKFTSIYTKDGFNELKKTVESLNVPVSEAKGNDIDFSKLDSLSDNGTKPGYDFGYSHEIQGAWQDVVNQAQNKGVDTSAHDNLYSKAGYEDLKADIASHEAKSSSKAGEISMEGTHLLDTNNHFDTHDKAEMLKDAKKYDLNVDAHKTWEELYDSIDNEKDAASTKLFNEAKSVGIDPGKYATDAELEDAIYFEKHFGKGQAVEPKVSQIPDKNKDVDYKHQPYQNIISKLNPTEKWKAQEDLLQEAKNLGIDITHQSFDALYEDIQNAKKNKSIFNPVTNEEALDIEKEANSLGIDASKFQSYDEIKKAIDNVKSEGLKTAGPYKTEGLNKLYQKYENPTPKDITYEQLDPTKFPKAKSYKDLPNLKTPEQKGYRQTLKPDEWSQVKKLGGYHGATLVEAPDGKKFVFKPAHAEFLMRTEEAASTIANSINGATPVARIVKGGTIQPHQGPLPSLRELHSDELKHVFDTHPEVVEQLQKEHVIDWLIGNHDPHPGQFLVHQTADGKYALTPIDKGQAFKHYFDDELHWDYDPNKKYGESQPIYNQLLKWARDSGKKLDFEHVKDAIHDAQMKGYTSHIDDKLTKLAKSRFSDLAEQKKFVQAYYDRLKNLETDFTKLYNDIGVMK